MRNHHPNSTFWTSECRDEKGHYHPKKNGSKTKSASKWEKCYQKIATGKPAKEKYEKYVMWGIVTAIRPLD